MVILLIRVRGVVQGRAGVVRPDLRLGTQNMAPSGLRGFPEWTGGRRGRIPARAGRWTRAASGPSLGPDPLDPCYKELNLDPPGGHDVRGSAGPRPPMGPYRQRSQA